MRYLFLTAAAWAHMDFGGMGLVRAARALQEGGHEVSWAFSPGHDGVLKEFLKSLGIPLSPLNRENLHLKLLGNRKEVLRTILRVSRYAKEEGVDALVSDRRCVFTAVAARLALIPWASVGSDGGPWMDRFYADAAEGWRWSAWQGPKRLSPMVEVAQTLGIPDLYKPCFSSAYLVSPYLNIAFFPERFFRTGPSWNRPAPSHFVGCEPPTKPVVSKRNKIVVTFGNSFYKPARLKLVQRLGELLQDRHPSVQAREILFLTGGLEQDAASLKALRDLARRHVRVMLKTWQSYGTAFQNASVAIGHGGTAHVWEAVRAGASVLAVSPRYDDQERNAGQIERLGVGKSLPFKKLNKVVLGGTLARIQADRRILKNVRAFRSRFFRGGGVPAAARLLEVLAECKSPVVNCPRTPCCC